MVETNGSNGAGSNAPERAPDGKWLPGHPPTPGSGRPAGSSDLLTIARRLAEENGRDLDEMTWAILERLQEHAASGEKGWLVAADMFLRNVFKSRNAAQILAAEVNVDNRQLTLGPQMPEGADLREWLERLQEVAEEQGLLEVVEAGE